MFTLLTSISSSWCWAVHCNLSSQLILSYRTMTSTTHFCYQPKVNPQQQNSTFPWGTPFGGRERCNQIMYHFILSQDSFPYFLINLSPHASTVNKSWPCTKTSYTSSTDLFPCDSQNKQSIAFPISWASNNNATPSVLATSSVSIPYFSCF